MLTLRLFGSPDLLGPQGRRYPSLVAQRKRFAVLALLSLAEGRALQRDRLLGLLWPELPEDRARNALSKALHHLRGALGEAVVEAGPGGEIRLGDRAVDCDVADFLAAAGSGRPTLALERLGDAEVMEGFHIPEAPEFDAWLDSLRRRVRRAARACALELADGASSAPEAVPWLRRALELDPFDEAILRRLVTALAEAGDRAGALAAARSFARRLKVELEIEPSPETTALLHRLRRGEDPDPTHPPRTPRAAKERPLETPTSETPTEAIPGPAVPSPLPATSRRRRSSRVGPWLGVAGIVLLPAVAARFTGGATEGGIRVLVAPLDSDSALAPFATVATDWIAVSLSSTGLADVVPARVSLAQVARAGPGGGDGLALAREARARLVVTGSVVREADSVHVFPQILSADGSIVRALPPVTGPAEDPGALLAPLQDRIAGALAGLLDTRVPASSTRASRPPRYAAYLEFVAGVEPWAAGDHARAADHFRRAYALDPDFLAPLPWLFESLVLAGAGASADSVLAEIGHRRDTLRPYEQAVLDWIESYRKGDREGVYRAARRRMELAPYDQDARWSLGWASLHTNRLTAARESFAAAEAQGGPLVETMIRLDWHALTLHLLGDYDAELDRVRRQQADAPDDPALCGREVRPLAAQGREAEVLAALAACDAHPAMDPAEAAGMLLGAAMELREHGHAELATHLADSVAVRLDPLIAIHPDLRRLRRLRFEAFLVAGRWSELLQAATDDPEPRVMPLHRLGLLAIAAAGLGDPARAEEAAEEMWAQALTPADTAWTHLRHGAILAHLDRPDEAVEHLRAAVAGGLTPAETFHAQRSLEPLRGHPGYTALVAPRR